MVLLQRSTTTPLLHQDQGRESIGLKVAQGGTLKILTGTDFSENPSHKHWGDGKI